MENEDQTVKKDLKAEDLGPSFSRVIKMKPRL
jgi:hypothetical protein